MAATVHVLLGAGMPTTSERRQAAGMQRMHGSQGKGGFGPTSHNTPRRELGIQLGGLRGGSAGEARCRLADLGGTALEGGTALDWLPGWLAAAAL